MLNTDGNDEAFEPLLPADVNDVGARINTEPNEKEKKNMAVRPSINTQIINNKKT